MAYTVKVESYPDRRGQCTDECSLDINKFQTHIGFVTMSWKSLSQLDT